MSKGGGGGGWDPGTRDHTYTDQRRGRPEASQTLKPGSPKLKPLKPRPGIPQPPSPASSARAEGPEYLTEDFKGSRV